LGDEDEKASMPLSSKGRGIGGQYYEKRGEL